MSVTEITTSTDPVDNWVKLQTFLDIYPEFSSHQMRWLLLNRKNNGLSEHVRKLGKSLYISRSGFSDWISGYQQR